jgi:Fe-S-cluster-containing hydrogenase component 2
MARSYTAAQAAPAKAAGQVPCEAKKEEEPVSAALKAEDTMKSYCPSCKLLLHMCPFEKIQVKSHSNLHNLALLSQETVQSLRCRAPWYHA